MCSKKGQRRCPALLAIREEALAEWCRAESLHDVRVAWGRLGGRVVLHRYGRGHFAELARRRRRAPQPGKEMIIINMLIAAVTDSPGRRVNRALRRPDPMLRRGLMYRSGSFVA